jgi:hypothetical protein
MKSVTYEIVMACIFAAIFGAVLTFAIMNETSDIESLTPDTEVFIDGAESSDPYGGPAFGVDMFLVLVNRPEDKVILLYGTQGYTDSSPLILTYDEFQDMWTRY